MATSGSQEKTMTAIPIPEGFGPIFRSSPVLDALGHFYSRGEGATLALGLLVSANHVNSRDRLHGGVIATFADVGMGYLMAFGTQPPRRMVTVSLNVDFIGAAHLGDWVDLAMDVPHIGSRIAMANARLMVGERQVARASAVFSITP